MRKNNILTYFCILIIGVLININYAFAQNNDDFDIFEDNSKTAINKKKKNTKYSSKTSNKSLSEVLETSQKDKENAEKKAIEKTSDIVTEDDEGESENWLESIIYGKTKAFLAGDNSIASTFDTEEIVKKAKRNSRANAANFDISYVRLRMNPAEVERILSKQGYRRIIQEMEVPNFIKWRSEELCRLHGIIGFERLNSCAIEVAKNNGYQFIKREVYNRYNTKESIDVYYTSTFTDNLSHHIYYKSNVPLSDSKVSKNVYINNLKIFDFWRRVSLKYGEPDNKSEIKWGLGGKKPYLKATTGTLELSDPLLQSLDVTRMFNEDTRLANTEYYTF